MAAQILCKNQGYPNKLTIFGKQLDIGFSYFATPTNQKKGGWLKFLEVQGSQYQQQLICINDLFLLSQKI